MYHGHNEVSEAIRDEEVITDSTNSVQSLASISIAEEEEVLDSTGPVVASASRLAISGAAALDDDIINRMITNILNIVMQDRVQLPIAEITTVDEVV